MRAAAAFATGTLAVLLQSSASALTITLDLEQLQDAAGVSMPVTGLVVLTAATSGTFYGPTPASFAGGDELVLKKWDLSAWMAPGVMQDSAPSLTLAGAWGVDDPLRVYWYPTLTLSSTAPGAGTSYGSYRDLVGIDGSDPWLTPANGASIALKFFTEDATVLRVGGSNPSNAGLASLRVVPEPSALALQTMALAAAGVFRPRRRSAVAPS